MMNVMIRRAGLKANRTLAVVATLLAAAPGAAAIPDATLAVDRLLRELQPKQKLQSRRLYRADAVITVFNIPIFSRVGVGSGFAVYEELAEAESRTIALQFAGGSRPDRAKGLNRLGYIQEVVVERNNRPTETAYFGFMTSSPEENLDQAKKALEASEGMLPYTAVDGSTGPGEMRSSKARFLFPPSYSWSNNDSLIKEVRTKFPSESGKPVEAKLSAKDVPWTFLYTVAQAASIAGEKSQWSYVYNGKQYRLRTERAQDAKMGRKLAEKGLVTKAENVWRLSGAITGPDNGPESTFKIWVEHNGESKLPMRIEFQARSFLRLVFEYDPTLDSAPIKGD
jgi:hypothetical protein